MQLRKIWLQTVFAVKLFTRCPELLLAVLPKPKKASLWDRD